MAGAQSAGTAFTYQGRLADTGSPANGPYDFQLILYTAAAGGSQVGPILTFGDVPVVDGLFTVNLDFGPGVFAGSARFLEIGVRPGASGGGYTLLGARQELKPAPHAVFSQQSVWSGLTGVPAGFADGVDNDSGGDVTGVTAGSGLAGGGTSGNVTVSANFGGSGAATTVSRSDHDHFGQTWAPAAAPAADGLAITTNNTANNRAAVYGISSATNSQNYGVRGRTMSGLGMGVFGEAVASGPGNAGVGVQGVTASGIGMGLYGSASHITGANYGVFGSSESSAGKGVYGTANASAGFTLGVEGVVNSPNGRGVYGHTAVPQGVGVFGEVTATAGTGIGVWGRNSANTGRGVLGRATGTTGPGVGVQGTTDSPTGVGVYGLATSTVPGTNYGIYGELTYALAFAGYFQGRVHVNGVLSKSGGAFKIDHPLDPENKYLSHSFVESPDMMNVYNGNVTTDESGYAVVKLPDWFEALNKDFRYQLTVLDQEDSAVFVQAKVVKKIAGNQFMLRTSQPATEVSWQVTGIRHDPFAEKNRIPVEEPKLEGERGRYLNPIDWGVPAERGMHRLRDSVEGPIEGVQASDSLR